MTTYRIVRRTGTTTMDAADLQTLADRLDLQDVLGVYLETTTPLASNRFGAPMGRPSERLDPKGRLTAQRVRIDSGGYDKGGAYWGLRPHGQHLYAVQDGIGNLAFVDAASAVAAKQEALA